MKDCWNKNPRVRPKFRTLLISVLRIQKNIKTKKRDNEAWKGASNVQSRRTSFSLVENDEDDYDVSTHTASYDYDAIQTL